AATNRNPRVMVRTWWPALARRAARAYVAGPALVDALSVCRRAVARGFTGTIGYWNSDEEEPEAVARTYQHALGALGADTLDCSLSVKATSLRFSRVLSAELVERARREDVRLHWDSLAPETVESTFAMIEDGLARHRRLGCTLPGRWRRSLRDAVRAAQLGLRVRVVKGQVPDAPRGEMDPLSGFLEVVDRLAGRAPFVTVATHDAELARAALRLLQASGTSCEVELLFGLPLGRVTRVAREADVPVRLYVPYGHPWLPYRLSDVGDKPAMLWWLARDLCVGRTVNAMRPWAMGSPRAA